MFLIRWCHFDAACFPWPETTKIQNCQKSIYAKILQRQQTLVSQSDSRVSCSLITQSCILFYHYTVTRTVLLYYHTVMHTKEYKLAEQCFTQWLDQKLDLFTVLSGKSSAHFQNICPKSCACSGGCWVWDYDRKAGNQAKKKVFSSAMGSKCSADHDRTQAVR